MYFKQVKEIVSGAKRCTQRVQKRGEAAVFEDDQIASVLTPGGVVKWRVGGVYCVAPTRGQTERGDQGQFADLPDEQGARRGISRPGLQECANQGDTH